jgi:hypothetical protein
MSASSTTLRVVNWQAGVIGIAGVAGIVLCAAAFVIARPDPAATTSAPAEQTAEPEDQQQTQSDTPENSRHGPGRRGQRPDDFGPPNMGPGMGPGMGPPGRPSRFGERFMRPEMRGASDELPSSEEWAVMTEFLTAHSPVRLRIHDRIVDRLGEDHPIVARIRMRYARLYRGLDITRQRIPDMYEFSLRQFELEDQLMGVIIRLNLRENENVAELKQLRDNLVSQFIENNLAERTKRLEHMRNMLKEEEDRLERDRQHLDRARDRVNRRFNDEFGPLLGRSREIFENESEVPTPTTAPTNSPSK